MQLVSIWRAHENLSEIGGGVEQCWKFGLHMCVPNVEFGL